MSRFKLFFLFMLGLHPPLLALDGGVVLERMLQKKEYDRYLSKDGRKLVMISHNSFRSSHAALMVSQSASILGDFGKGINAEYSEFETACLVDLDYIKRGCRALPELTGAISLKWSPDSQRIAFVHFNKARRSLELSILHLKTRKVVTLNEPVHAMAPDDQFFGWADASRLYLLKKSSRPTGFSSTMNVYQTQKFSAKFSVEADFISGRLPLATILKSDLIVFRLDHGGPQLLATDLPINRISVSPDGDYFLLEERRVEPGGPQSFHKVPRRNFVIDKRGQTVFEGPWEDPSQVDVKAAQMFKIAREFHWHPAHAHRLIWLEPHGRGDRIKFADAPVFQPIDTKWRAERMINTIHWDQEGRIYLTTLDKVERVLQVYLGAFQEPGNLQLSLLQTIDSSNPNLKPLVPLFKHRRVVHRLLLSQDDNVFLPTAQGQLKEFRFPKPEAAHRNNCSLVEISHKPQSDSVWDCEFPEGGVILHERNGKSDKITYGERSQDLHTFFQQLQTEVLTLHSSALDLDMKVHGYFQSSGKLPAVVFVHPRWFATREEVALWLKKRAGNKLQTNPHGISYLPFDGFFAVDDLVVPLLETTEISAVEQFSRFLDDLVIQLQAQPFIDSTRIYLVGHSYAANFLAQYLSRDHGRKVQAAVLRSGSYNRTLNMFGYEGQKNTLWEAPESYRSDSPLLAASTIQARVLLVHGLLDGNRATAPLQSRMFFAALDNMNIDAKLLEFNQEGHLYQMKDSFRTLRLAMLEWFSPSEQSQDRQGQAESASHQVTASKNEISRKRGTSLNK